MNRQRPDLLPGDVIDIKYRIWQSIDGQSDIVERWVRAMIVDAGPDVRPLAQLADGQVTEIRDYMTWRRLASASQSDLRRLAA